jgi:hypothetical protein
MLSWSRNPDFVELEFSKHVHKASKYTLFEPAETTQISDKIYFIISLVFQVVSFLQVLGLNFCMNFSPLASVLHIPPTHLPWYHDNIW